MQTAKDAWKTLWGWHGDVLETIRFFTSGSTPVGVNGGVQTDRSPEPSANPGQKIGFVLGPLLFFLIILFFSPEGLSKEAVAVLAGTVWIATWWITEAIPIPATSLLPIILFPVTGALQSGDVTSAYGDGTIFLFMGGFIIAIAMEKWNLHKRIAMNIILLIGTSTERIVLGFMLATGFLSMWISNTATAMMMLPIGTAVIYQVNESLKKEGAKRTGHFSKVIMLGIAYSASIGGLGTLIGTPPNTIFAAVLKQLYGIDFSFAKWMLFGVPLAAILLIATWWYLIKLAFPLKIKELPGGREIVEKENRSLGRISFEEKLVLTVFSVTALCWITRSFLLNQWIPSLDDTIIAMTGAIALFLLPGRKEARLINWEDAKKLPWGILLLFGGGLAIAKGFKETGLAEWIGKQLTVLEGVSFIIILAAVTIFVIFLTEITSNTATATMMFPIMAALAAALDVHPYSLMVAAGLAASCAFMLPVATPPNAVVFGSGYIKMGDMVKAGIWLNLISIIFITLMIYFVMPLVWGVDLSAFPVHLK
ncbi:DASS family sodium-coupled anion symporter [Rossellomorea sp. SC111]|uniref:SLC13 family permease n=1 Tax=Rossellomorea sp. SC111 TaxID=2968985 RepID=UPI00215AA967|nr:DASS family sodium-coupled anion symporter [Rossellomorea sp. SC111]MCR8849542.1 DASS family sodium-coupled anion symporter [Rossellomorea sp. SC111]